MHLTKLFNFKYLIQNFKKSKGLIILLTILVPMFTSIMLISMDGTSTISFMELSTINIVGMYIIPVVLSMTLFNYVYKKNSVDFIGSMPLSRKTIFLTNTFGGVAIILIMQLLNLVSTLFLAQVLNSLVIFASMAWDIFVFFTVAYIFVFTISNLAMSFSGNKFSQLVSICLIVFLIPFLMLSCELFGDDYYYTNLSFNSNPESERIEIEQNTYYTAPSYFFGMLYGAQYEYHTESVVKMLVLSIIYTVIGLLLFERKKLEMAGESYENIWVHLIVKLLTFVPFMFVFCAMDSTDRWNIALFFIAILAVYYFVFDLITNKKVKLKISIPAFIISAVVVFAIYEGIIPKFGRNNIKAINVSNIQAVYIDSFSSGSRFESAFNLKIQDKDLIKLIVTASEYIGLRDSSSYSSDSVEIYTEYTEPLKLAGCSTKIILKLKNGKEYEYRRYLDSEIYEKIFEKYGDKKSNLELSGIVPVLSGQSLTDKQKEKLKASIAKDLNNISYEELYKLYDSEEALYSLNAYEYKNHKLVAYNMSYKSLKNTFEETANLSRELTVNNIDRIGSFYIKSSNDILNLIIKYNPEINFNEENEKIVRENIYEILNLAATDIKAFMKKDINSRFDIEKEYIGVSCGYPSYYYTNNIEDFYNILAKTFNKRVENYNIKLIENV